MEQHLHKRTLINHRVWPKGATLQQKGCFFICERASIDSAHGRYSSSRAQTATPIEWVATLPETGGGLRMASNHADLFPLFLVITRSEEQTKNKQVQESQQTNLKLSLT
eukprot:488110-Amphidinium_carterae.1